LNEWSENQNKKDKRVPTTAPTTKPSQLPPIRNKIDISQSIKTAQTEQANKKSSQPIVPELEKFKRDSSAMPEYYKAWDKFAKLADEEDEENESTSTVKAVPAKQATTAAEMMQRTSGAAPNTSIVVKGGLRKQVSLAEEFKT
jgi:hypothetical protein